MNKTGILGMGGKVRSGGAPMLALLVLGVLGVAGASRVMAATVADVLAALDGNAGKIASLHLHLAWTTENVDGQGKVSRRFVNQEEFWFDRELKRMRHKQGADDQLFDHAKHVMKRRVNGGVLKETFDRPIEQDTPAVFQYVLYPRHAIESLDAGAVEVRGRAAILTAYPRGLSAQQRAAGTRREFEVDLHRGTVEAVRIFGNGRLVNEVVLTGIQQAGGVWLPRQVRLRAIGVRNTVRVTYTLNAVEANSVQPAALEMN